MIALLRCWSARNLLDLYVDRRLSAGQAARVARHLAGCADCREEAEAMSPLPAALAGPVETPAGLAASILEAYERGQDAAAPAWRPAELLRLRPAQGLALVYCALLAGLNLRPGLPSQAGLAPYPAGAHTVPPPAPAPEARR